MIEINDMFYAKSSDAAIAEAGEYGGAVTTLLKFLLKEGIVDAVLAVDSSADLYDVVPILIEDPDKVVDAAGSLHFGTLNLAKFVTRYLDGAQDMKIAVTVKPCDAMTMVELMKREKVNADNVIMVGLNCGGTMPPVKGRMMMEQFYEVDPDSVVKEEIAKGKLIVETEDCTEKEIPIDVLEDEGFGRRTNCRRCEVNIPRMADLACGNWGVIGACSSIALSSPDSSLSLEGKNAIGGFPSSIPLVYPKVFLILVFTSCQILARGISPGHTSSHCPQFVQDSAMCSILSKWNIGDGGISPLVSQSGPLLASRQQSSQ